MCQFVRPISRSPFSREVADCKTCRYSELADAAPPGNPPLIAESSDESATRPARLISLCERPRFTPKEVCADVYPVE